jgi:hypothetical protein
MRSSDDELLTVRSFRIAQVCKWKAMLSLSKREEYKPTEALKPDKSSKIARKLLHRPSDQGRTEDDQAQTSTLSRLKVPSACKGQSLRGYQKFLRTRVLNPELRRL